MNSKINLLNKGILRTPLLPIDKSNNLTKELILEIASNKDFQEAISISSYSFYQRLINWLNNGCKDEEFYITLYKYIVRSSTRSTPFGCFGSISYLSTVSEQREENKKFELNFIQKKHTKVDGRLLHKIIDYFEKIIDVEYLRFFFFF